MNLIKSLLSIICLAIVLVQAQPALAGSAVFTVSATAQPVEVGDTFVVNVNLNPAGSSVDTARSILSFSSDIISAVNVSLGGALDSPSPGNSINNSSGTISWGGFTVDRQLTSSGLFARATFKANAVGEAVISVNSSSRIISDGNEVGNPSGYNQVKVSIIPATNDGNELLQLSSTTHPNQEVWYQSTTAQFTWNTIPNATYLWHWDREPETIPAQVSKEPNKTIRNIKSGIWYFHLQAKLSDGNITKPIHYRVQVDNVKPNPIEPYLDVNDQQQLTVRFATTDYHSGVTTYDLRVNQEDIENAPNPYILRGLNVGENFIVVTAYDAAGNVRQGWVKFVLNSDGTIRDITVSQDACSLPFGCDSRGYIILFGFPVLILIFYLIYIRKGKKNILVANSGDSPTPNTGEQVQIIQRPDGSIVRSRTHTHTHTSTDTDTVTDTLPAGMLGQNRVIPLEITSDLEKNSKKGSGKKNPKRKK